MGTLLLTLGVAGLLFVGIVSAITLNQVRRVRLAPPQTSGVLALDVPEDVRALLAPGLAELDALGFAHPAALRQTSRLVAGQPVAQHGLVLLHGAVPAAAYVYQLLAPDRGRAWSLFFVSRSKAGHTLLTRNRASTAGSMPLPDVTTQDLWASDWPTVWRAHQQRMKRLEPDPAQWRWLSAPAWIEAGGASETAAFQARVQRGDLIDAGGGAWAFGLRAALGVVLRVWRTAFVSSRGMAGEAPTAAGRAVGVDGLVEAFERGSAAHHAGRWSNGAKWLLFFVTAAAAAASFGLGMDLGAVPTLVAVLLFHELGHFAAMRWAGYRDLKVFFLPFLGAAVSGRHEHPSAAQELLVLFAGPVPGLVLGLAALWGLPAGMPHAQAWHGAAALAVTLNAFNLLPIHPLDGGKIFEILLLGRWPWLAFAGRVLGIVAFAGLALATHSEVGRGVLWGVVLLMLLGLNHQRQEARLAASLRAEGAFGGQSRGDALRALFTAMQRLGLGARAWATQRALAEALLPAMTRPRLSRLARSGGLGVYAFFLFLPLIALLGSVWMGARGAVQRAAEVDAAASPAASAPGATDRNRVARQVDALFASLQARVNAEPDPARRWALLVDEFGDQAGSIGSMGPGQLPAAEALLRQAEDLAARQPDARSAQAQVALWQAQALPDGPPRQQSLLALMARYDDPATAPADKQTLVRAALDWLYAGGHAEPGQRARVIDRALAQAGPPLPPHLGLALRELQVDQWLAEGQADRASQQARDWFDAALKAGAADPLEQAARLRVDLVLVSQGAAAALHELDGVLAPLEALAADRRPDLSRLRRHGMQLAEVAGRSDWQRAQVVHLPTPGDAALPLPWWGRALVWASRGGSGPPPSWLALEHLHWQGDSAGAARVAAALKQRSPAALARGAASTDGLGPLAAARTRLQADARRSVALRYGLAS